MKIYKYIIFPILLSITLATVFGVLLQSIVGKEYFLADIGGIGWLLGVVGTIYTLVAAFTMVEVWSQFNSTSNLISREAKVLISLWNYANYLNDTKLDQQLRHALLSYIDVTMQHEHRDATLGVRSRQSSPAFLGILQAIDHVKFNDSRDASIFPLLTQSCEELATIRSDRIEASVTRLPSMIKVFFIALSIMLMISYILVGYVHLPLYLIHTISGATIISLTYKIILDLDNPFDGYWNLDYSALTQAKDHISLNRHTH